MSPSRTVKQKAILRSARGLVLAHGYAETSMEAIAHDAGVSKQTLYAYYDSKTALVADVLADLAAEGTSSFDLSPDTIASPEQIRTRVIELALSLTEVRRGPDHVAMIRLAIAEADRYPDLARQFRVAIRDHGIDVVAGHLGVLAPQANQSAVRLAASAFTSHLFTAAVLDALLAGEQSGPTRSDIAKLLQILEAGLVALETESKSP